EGDPETALRHAIKTLAGLDIPADAWQDFTPSHHLQMRFEIISEDGRVLATGRDLQTLREKLGERARAAVASAADHDLSRRDLQSWPQDVRFDQPVVLEQSGLRIEARPALVDRGDRVDLEILDDVAAAAHAHRYGVIRLLRQTAARQIRMVKKDLAGL